MNSSGIGVLSLFVLLNILLEVAFFAVFHDDVHFLLLFNVDSVDILDNKSASEFSHYIDFGY